MSNDTKKLVLVCAIVFGVFYVTVFGDLCIVDDFSYIMWLSSTKALTVKQLFLPKSVGGGYYRPLVGLSYLINLQLWDLDIKTLHLENVLLHTANALLVYLLALSLLPKERRERSLIPLGAALIFGVHPIATESVDWISGRTDLIAGLGVLLAAILVLRYKESRSPYSAAGAVLCILIGMMGKEVAVGFIPGALLLLWGPKAEEPPAGAPLLPVPSFRETLWFLGVTALVVIPAVLFFNFWSLFLAAPLYALHRYRENRSVGSPQTGGGAVFAGCVVAALGAIGLIWGVRRVVFTSNISRIPETLKTMLQEPNHTISVFLGSIGFYVKKFFLPLPLNFAIREIDPFYNLLGIVLIFVGIAFLLKRSLPRNLALTGVFLFAPALPLALGTFAWTAYAERYIYVAAAFWSIGVALWLGPHLARLGNRGRALVAAVIVVAAVCTIQRNLVWQQSLTLMADTVKKSPRFRDARAIYMGELLKVGDLKGAEEQYRVAVSLPAVRYDERLDLGLAQLRLRQGREEEAVRTFETIYQKTKGSSDAARTWLVQLLKARLAQTTDPSRRDELQRQIERYQRGTAGASSVAAG